MGDESVKDGGDAYPPPPPVVEKSAGDVPPEMGIFKKLFLDI